MNLCLFFPLVQRYEHKQYSAENLDEKATAAALLLNLLASRAPPAGPVLSQQFSEIVASVRTCLFTAPRQRGGFEGHLSRLGCPAGRYFPLPAWTRAPLDNRFTLVLLMRTLHRPHSLSGLDVSMPTDAAGDVIFSPAAHMFYVAN